MDKIEEIINDMPKGLWKWYNFKPDSSILFIDDTKKNFQDKFDYIISIANLETELHPIDALKKWKSMLKPNGCLLLGMNNRLGIRYFCGDRDPYTKRNFDGIENYNRAYTNKSDTFNGRMYSRFEIEEILRIAGWNNFKFFSVLTDLQNPSLIYAEDYLPNEDLSNRIFPTYNYPDTVFLAEETLYSTLIENGLFHKMANAYLIECPLDGNFSDVLHVTSSINRGREDALFTIIHKDGIVEKKSVYPEGRQRLEDLFNNIQDLKSRGLSVIEGKLVDDRYIMPYVNAEASQIYFKKLLRENKEKFLQEFDHFRECILKSSEIVTEDSEEGIILRKGYIDMVLLNSFYIDNDFVFYDQEFFIENLPLNVILSRVITTFYFGNNESDDILPANELYERYGLLQDKIKWQRMGSKFLSKLRNDKELAVYNSKIRQNKMLVNANRQRLNYSIEEYQRIFVDIFRNADTRKLVLFGSGRRTSRFLELYGMDYNIYAIVDNNPERQGQEMNGSKIQSPEILNDLQSGEYKVIVCIKNYLSVMKQLEDMGVTDYGKT